VSKMHICRGTGRYFQARCRMPGTHKWDWLGPKRKSSLRALQDMVRKWDKDVGRRHIEANVIMVLDWYGPTTIASLRRK
jgi:hypothetical protein